MPCQVRQGKRQRPGLAFVKNDYSRQGRRGFSFGKDIMETNTFEYIWSLLNPQGEFVQLPRGFTVLSSMAHRTFYVYYVRIGFGQRLSEPPCIDHAWSISLRFPLFSYIYENQSRGPHRNQRSVSYGESRGVVALL